MFDFYLNKPITVNLKINQTPQKAAELLYRKQKNRGIEVNKLREVIDQKSLILKKLKEQKNLISSSDSIKEVKKHYSKTKKFNDAEKEAQLFRSFEFDGYTILVGKNARSNDELTFKRAKKNDVWLHARAVSGSHVVILNPTNKVMPSSVIEYAASLAAFFSKSRGEKFCPVIYTERKHVRRPKGGRAGQVIVDREKVLMAEPSQN